MTTVVADLSPETRRNLVQLAALAAWADLQVVPSERQVVLELAASLAFDEEGLAEVETWLNGAPPEIDPNDIPAEHRQLFLDSLLEVIMADGRIAPEESAMLAVLRELLLG